MLDTNCKKPFALEFCPRRPLHTHPWLIALHARLLQILLQAYRHTVQTPYLKNSCSIVKGPGAPKLIDTTMRY